MLLSREAMRVASLDVCEGVDAVCRWKLFTLEGRDAPKSREEGVMRAKGKFDSWLALGEVGSSAGLGQPFIGRVPVRSWDGTSSFKTGERTHYNIAKQRMDN